MKARRMVSAMMAVILAAGMSFPSLAADEKIDKVRLSFSYSKEPKTGDDIGDISVRGEGNGYTVESAEYTNAEDKDVWTVGDVPEVKVELSADDGYRFSYTSKSHFSISGSSAEFKRAKIYDDGDFMEVYVELDRVGGKLSGAETLEWSETTAEWDEVEGAKSYEVKLLRNDRTVTTVSTSQTYYNFGGYFNKEGDYTFRVRAIASYNNKAGEWSEDSDTFTIDEDEIGNYSGSGKWRQDSKGWWYAYDMGGYPLSTWKQIDGAWYHFDNSGYRQTGWQRLDGQWYYFNGNGVMLTGWQAINGQWYYFNGSGDMVTGWQSIGERWYYFNSSGAMLTGWQRLGGQWYYLDGNGVMLTGWQAIGGKWYCFHQNGSMYESTWTPDGYYVNGSGVWVQ